MGGGNSVAEVLAGDRALLLHAVPQAAFPWCFRYLSRGAMLVGEREIRCACLLHELGVPDRRNVLSARQTWKHQTSIMLKGLLGPFVGICNLICRVQRDQHKRRNKRAKRSAGFAIVSLARVSIFYI